MPAALAQWFSEIVAGERIVIGDGERTQADTDRFVH